MAEMREVLRMPMESANSPISMIWYINVYINSFAKTKYLNNRTGGLTPGTKT